MGQSKIPAPTVVAYNRIRVASSVSSNVTIDKQICTMVSGRPTNVNMQITTSDAIASNTIILQGLSSDTTYGKYYFRAEEVTYSFLREANGNIKTNVNLPAGTYLLKIPY